MHPPREFQLVAACCRWPPDPGAVEAAAAAGVDWHRLLAVAARHRVEGLVHQALRGAAPPPTVAEPLAAAARDIVRRNLAFAAESGRLAGALDAAGLVFLFVKGVTLNLLAYGTLAVKRSVDIDLVVDPADYPAAIALLRARGYRCVLPGEAADSAALERAAGADKHSVWERAGIALELHHRFVDSPLMLRGVSLTSPRQRVEVSPGLNLPTLAGDELFAYLCVHGATHGWSRLKWLADVNALLAPAGDGELERLYRRSLELGGGRSAGQALLLCADLLGRRLPAGLERELRGDRALRSLARSAANAMARGGGTVELDRLVLGTAAIHLSHFRLMPGWRYKAGELRRKLAPGGSGPFAPLLAGPRWLLRRAKTARARNRAGR